MRASWSSHGRGLPGQRSVRTRQRAMTCALIVAALVMVVTGIVALPATASAPAQWTTDTSYSPTAADLSAVACPSASVCEAVGYDAAFLGAVYNTANGGITWTRQVVPPGVSSIVDISCPSVDNCIAVGETTNYESVVLTTTDGGLTWSAQYPQSFPTLVACASVTTCEAVGAGVSMRTTDFGLHWTVGNGPPLGDGRATALACPTTSICEVVAADGALAARTVDGGEIWTAETLPTGVTGLYGVACPKKAVCEAVGEGTQGGVALSTQNGGLTWTVSTLPSGVLPGSIACPSVTSCELVGPPGGIGGSPSAMGTADGGAVWTAQNLGVPVSTNQESVSGVACATTSSCEAVGTLAPTTGGCVRDVNCNIYMGLVIGTTDAGGTWTAQSLPQPVGTLSSVACASSSSCEAVGYGTDGDVVLGTDDGGTNWTQQGTTFLPGSILAGVACPSSSACQAVGTSANAGLILGTTNGGSTWTNESVPTNVEALLGIDCPSTSVCEAVGTETVPSEGVPVGVVLGTTDGGASWSEQTLPTVEGPLFAVACSSNSTCEVVGTDVADDQAVALGTADDGTSWTAQSLPSTATLLTGVACPTVSACEAVGVQSALRTDDGGTRWIAQSVPADPGTLLSDVACPSPSTCEAVGGGVAERSTNAQSVFGALWRLQTLPSPTADLTSVACPSDSLCYGVGVTDTGSGVVLAYG